MLLHVNLFSSVCVCFGTVQSYSQMQIKTTRNHIEINKTVCSIIYNYILHFFINNHINKHIHIINKPLFVIARILDIMHVYSILITSVNNGIETCIKIRISDVIPIIFLRAMRQGVLLIVSSCYRILCCYCSLTSLLVSTSHLLDKTIPSVRRFKLICPVCYKFVSFNRQSWRMLLVRVVSNPTTCSNKLLPFYVTEQLILFGMYANTKKKIKRAGLIFNHFYSSLKLYR